MVPATLEATALPSFVCLRSRRVGVVTYYRMLREYGSSPAPRWGFARGLHAPQGVKTIASAPRTSCRQSCARPKALAARLVTHDKRSLPSPHLAELRRRPPVSMGHRDIDLLAAALGGRIVGARNASSLGTRMNTRPWRATWEVRGLTSYPGLATGHSTPRRIKPRWIPHHRPFQAWRRRDLSCREYRSCPILPPRACAFGNSPSACNRMARQFSQPQQDHRKGWPRARVVVERRRKSAA